MEKEKEKLLITGGLGFIGANLAKRLCNKFKIIIVDIDKSDQAKRAAENLRNCDVEIRQEDITVPKTWIDLPDCKYIFHAAAQVAAELSWEIPEIDFLTNVCGTFLVAEYARKHNSRIIYCNSIRVYDPDSVEILMESQGKVSERCATIDSSSKPQPPFALSKYFGERYLSYYSHMYGLKVISNRMSGIVGPGQEGSQIHGWIAHLVHSAIEKKKYTIFGDGNQSRDILHINDFLGIVENELENFETYSENGFGIYNVGGGPSNKLSINQVLNILANEFSLKLKVERTPPRVGEPRHYATDNEKIRGRGWDSMITDTMTIIREMINWYEKG